MICNPIVVPDERDQDIWWLWCMAHNRPVLVCAAVRGYKP